MTSPVFQAAWRALQQGSRSNASPRTLVSLASSLSGGGARQWQSGTENALRKQIVDSVLKKLGNVGQLVSALLRPQGKVLTDQIADEMKAAMDLLHAFHRIETGRPGWLPNRRNTIPSRSGTGGSGPPSVGTGAGASGGGSPPPERSNVPAGFVARESLGRRYQFPENDPIVTGEMIDVISSNVHSIGYEWNFNEPNRGTLKVRFLEGKGRKSKTRAAGPLYYYFNVNPEVFIAFQVAASKGRFVWDRLRVRGTVSGSRYHYELEDLGASDYVPRKASRLGPNEHFLKREFIDKRTGRTSTSQLEDEFVQRLGLNRHGPQGFVPQRGTPNRGTPNRGR